MATGQLMTDDEVFGQQPTPTPPQPAAAPPPAVPPKVLSDAEVFGTAPAAPAPTPAPQTAAPAPQPVPPPAPKTEEGTPLLTDADIFSQTKPLDDDHVFTDQTTASISNKAASNALMAFNFAVNPFKAATDAVLPAIEHPIDSLKALIQKGGTAVSQFEGMPMVGLAGLNHMLAQFDIASRAAHTPPAVPFAGGISPRATANLTEEGKTAKTAPEDTKMYQLGSAIIDHWQETQRQHLAAIKTFGEPLNSMLDTAGSLAPYVAIGALGGPGADVAMTPLMTLSGGGQQLKDAVEHKATDSQKDAATGIGMALGASYLIPAHVAFSQIAKVPGGQALIDKVALSRFWKGAALPVTAGLQQAAYQVFSNMTARDFAGYDPSRSPWDGVKDALIGGIGAGAFMGHIIKLASPEEAAAVPSIEHFEANTSARLASLPKTGTIGLDTLKEATHTTPGPEGEAIRATLEKFEGQESVDAQTFQHAVQDKLLPYKVHSLYGAHSFLVGSAPRQETPERAQNAFTHVIRAPYISGEVARRSDSPLSRVFPDYNGHINGYYEGVTPHITEIRTPISADPEAKVILAAKQAVLVHATRGDSVLNFAVHPDEPLAKWLTEQGAYPVRIEGTRKELQLPLKQEWGNKAQISADETGLGFILRQHTAALDDKVGEPPSKPPTGGNEPPERFPPGEEPVRENLDRFWLGSKIGDTIRMLAYKNRQVPVLGKLLSNYLGTVQRWANTSLAWRYRGAETLNSFRKFNTKDRNSVAKFIYALGEISQAQKKRFEIGSPDYINLAKKYGLNEAQLAFHKRLDGDFQASLQAIKQVWLKEAQRIYLPDNEASYNNAAAEIGKTIDRIGNQNYIPFSRFGKRAVSATATDEFTDKLGRNWKPNELVEMQTLEGPFSNTRGKLLANQMASKYKGLPVRVVPHWLTDKGHTWEGLPPEMKDIISKSLGLDENQRSSLADLMAAMSPARSFARHMMERKGTPGYSKDLGRSIAEYFTNFSSHIARLEHSGEFRDVLNQVQQSGMRLRDIGLDNMKRMQIYEHLNEHYDYLMNPQNELSGLKSLAYLYYLSYLPRTAAIVLSQQPLFIYPHLAALAGHVGVGDIKAGGALAGAYKTQITRGYGAIKDSLLRKIYEKSASDSSQRFVRPGVIEDDLSTVLQRLEREGVINQAFNSELAAASKGSLLDRFMITDPVIKGLRSMAAFGSYPLSLMEKMNRQLTAIAAHRIIRTQMEKARDMKVKDFSAQDKEDLYNQVKEAVLNTNFEYHRWNRPTYMRGKKSALFVFTHFFREALFFQRHMPGRGRSLLMLAGMAGLTGLPFVQNLEDLYNAFMNSPLGRKTFNTPSGKYIDIDSDAHEALNNLLSHTNAPKALGMNSQQLTELIMHGALHRYALGPAMLLNAVGGNLPDMDMTSAVAEGRLFPGTEFASGLASHQYPDFASKLQGAATATAGVMGGLGQRLVQAVVQPNPDTYKEIEALTPRVVNTTMKAARAAHDGYFSSSGGSNLGYVDMKNPAQAAELISMGLTGFQPTRLTEAQEVSWKEQQASKFFEGQRRMLLGALAQAFTDHDKTAEDAAFAEIRKFNASAPKGVFIVDKSIIDALRSSAAKAYAKAHARDTRLQAAEAKTVMPAFQGPQGQPFQKQPNP